MGTAISCAIVVAILGIFFIMLLYLVFSLIVSVIKNIGKDEFIWYGLPLYTSHPKAVDYDSFKDMVKDGLLMSLKMTALNLVLLLIVFIYVELTG